MPNPGDTVEVKTKKEVICGMLMPSSKKDVVMLKLDNGYNMGFKKKEVSIKVIAKAKETKSKSEKVTKDKNLPTISILHTGGTIASKVDYKTGGVVSSFEPAELVAQFPELQKLANVESELIAQMWSDDLRFSHFALMAKKIEEHIKKGVKGIVIGMGTDNLAVAAAALSFIIENSPIPILFVGSQRSSDRGSSDAGMNLICATEFITKTDFKGVAICMHHSSNDDICAILPATKTYKLHTSRRDAFKAINDQPIALVNYKTRKITFTKGKEPQKQDSKQQLIIKPKMEDKVGFLKISIHMLPEQFEFFAQHKFKGLIIEGTGLGHTPGQAPNKESALHKKIYPALKKLIDSGCVVVMTSQCLFGSVNMNVYSKGRDLLELGIISGKDMLANTAFVKLAWLLGNYKSDEVANLMAQNLRGEINNSLKYEQHFPPQQ